jgi:hypothetical protein
LNFAKGLSLNSKGIVAQMVSEYFERKSLSEIGYRFDSSDLTCYEAEIFFTVSAALSDHAKREGEKLKAKAKAKRGRR